MKEIEIANFNFMTSSVHKIKSGGQKMRSKIAIYVEVRV
jgi:hypothetical protein